MLGKELMALNMHYDDIEQRKQEGENAARMTGRDDFKTVLNYMVLPIDVPPSVPSCSRDLRLKKDLPTWHELFLGNMTQRMATNTTKMQMFKIPFSS